MKRLIVGVSGGSGMPIAIELLRLLKENKEIETHLIITRSAELTLSQESDVTLEELRAMADVIYDNENIGAGPASGTFKTIGMIVVPCSMKTAAGIATGYSDSLLLRACDVTLKERRRLVLVPRECPLSTVHLRNLLELSEMGAMILPPMLAYYNHPKTIEDATVHVAGKILDCFDLEAEGYRRWEGMQ